MFCVQQNRSLFLRRRKAGHRKASGASKKERARWTVIAGSPPDSSPASREADIDVDQETLTPRSAAAVCIQHQT